MTVATTSDSPSTSSLVVWVRQYDGSACQASSSAVRHALPAAVEVYADRRRTEPVTFDVAGLPFAGAMRICGFVQIVPAPGGGDRHFADARGRSFLRLALVRRRPPARDRGSIRLKIAGGGRCVDTQARLLRHGFEWLCTLKSRPRAPFRFRFTYSTGLGLDRATRRISIAVPRRQHRKHRH
jgi:hypothetical protein